MKKLTKIVNLTPQRKSEISAIIKKGINKTDNVTSTNKGTESTLSMKKLDNEKSKLIFSTMHFNKQRIERLAIIAKTKKALDTAIKNNDGIKIYEYFGFNPKADKEGFLTLSSYKQPYKGVTFADIGIDEKKLFEKVRIIEGDANFSSGSKIDKLENLEIVTGNLTTPKKQKFDFGSLRSVNGNANCEGIVADAPKNLVHIGGNANFSRAEMPSLGNLQYVGKNLILDNAKIKDTGNLQDVMGNISALGAKTKSMPNLKSVSGDIDISGAEVNSLPKLSLVGGSIKTYGQKSLQIDSLVTIGKDAYLKFIDLKKNDNLRTIGGNAFMTGLKSKTTGGLRTVGGHLLLPLSKVKNTAVKSVGGDLFIEDTVLRNVNSLRTVGGEAWLSSDVENHKLLEKQLLNKNIEVKKDRRYYTLDYEGWKK